MSEPQYHLAAVVQTKSDEREDFEGPLDLIFLLLSKNKIEIQNVSITAILEQYLAYLDEMKRMDMEIASEFIAMASRLMLIKTKMLLSASERAEAESEMEQLRHSLEERRRKEAFDQIKTASMFLEQRGEIGRCLFPKEPEPLRRDKVYRYRHDRMDLAAVLAALVERSMQKLPSPVANFQGIVGKEPYPVAVKSRQILRRLLLQGKTGLSDLFRDAGSRSEVVATFLAVLELCRVASVLLEGEGENVTVSFQKMPEDPDEQIEQGV